MCHQLIVTYKHECDLFYIKCATENRNPLIRFEGYKGLINTNPLNHLRLIIYGTRDTNINIRMLCLDYLLNYFKLSQFQEFFLYISTITIDSNPLCRENIPQLSSLMKAIETVLNSNTHEEQQFSEEVLLRLEEMLSVCDAIYKYKI